jgi:hypothetical protein
MRETEVPTPWMVLLDGGPARPLVHRPDSDGNRGSLLDASVDTIE